jgi:poly-gamma-glutamate capsule biosynthesis protein CapA/YwtB (metallophosphatase superfamily)
MVTIGLLGDIVLQRPVPRHDGAAGRADLVRCLEEASWVAGNLEVPLTDHVDPQPWGMRSLRAPAERADDLVALGIDAVSLANNHSSDQGWLGLQGTAAACAARGIDTAGIGSDRAASLVPTIVAAQRWSAGRSEHPLALLAVSCIGHPDMFAGTGPGIASLAVTTEFVVDAERVHEQPGWPARAVTAAEPGSLAEVAAAVRSARALTPVVVVSMHWGVTLQEELADYQREVARALVEAGATVVFGHQAHVLQALEWIADTPVFYGLGSFVFHYEGDITAKVPDDTAVALVDIDPAEGRVTGARLAIGRLDEDGHAHDGAPDWCAAVAERVLRLSHGLDGRREHDGGGTITLAHAGEHGGGR